MADRSDQGSPESRSSGKWKADALALLALYVITLLLFFPLIERDSRMSPTPDTITARAMNDVGAEITKSEPGPVALWNPYIFLGMPMYASLSYKVGSLLNPMDYVTNVGEYLFGWDRDRMRREVFFYFFSGVAMFLFARGVGLPTWAALLAGLIFMMNPYNISLLEAGHGGKHWTISILPMVFLTTHWTLTRRRILDIALLALAVGSLLLLHHPQIAYFGLLVIGGYALIWAIGEWIHRRPKIAAKGIGFMAMGGLLGLAVSAYLYLPVWQYMKYSIRGAAPLFAKVGTASGLDWNYATGWSLHPLETLQFLVPGLFGLGGSAAPDRLLNMQNAANYNLYWGWMPFTQSSLYMGILPLILAVVAAVLLWKKNAVVRWMAVAALAALVVSFGRFLPVLYGPLYYLLPYFDKFRVPSMILVITAAGVSILSAYGIEAILKSFQGSPEKPQMKRWRILFGTLAGVAVLGLIVGLAGGRGPSVQSGWFIRPQEIQTYGRQAQALVALRYVIFTKTLISTSLVLLFFSLAGWSMTVLKNSRKTMTGILAGLVLLLTAVDLMVLDKRFIHPVQPKEMSKMLAIRPTVDWLKQRQMTSEEPFRIFPVGSDFQTDYWMYHRIQSIGGYSAVKLRVYQDMLDFALLTKGQNGEPNWTIAGMMNARFILSSQRLPGGFEAAYAEPGGGMIVYRNPKAMPRAWFVENVRQVTDLKETIGIIGMPGFNPRTLAIIDQPVDFPFEGADSLSKAVMPAESFHPSRFTINTSSVKNGFLVISEIWYPTGWTATVDDSPVPIVRTNYGLRGVAVPAGEHTLRFEYRSQSIQAGFLISELALVIVAVMLLLEMVRWLRARREDQSTESDAG
ncbi:MAG: YfhO family protein [bacterium]